jgi:hypothetical protein
MQILHSSSPKARKEHKCCFCFAKIKIGSVYDLQTNIFDGDIYTWKAHKRCSQIAEKLKMYDYADEGVTSEDFQETIKEEFHNLQTTEDYDIPDFYGQLDFVCNKHLELVNQ